VHRSQLTKLLML